MRWPAQLKNKDTPNKRCVCKFLFLPKKLNDEWRWLEFSCIEQKKLRLTQLHPDSQFTNEYEKWVDIKWAREYSSMQDFLMNCPFKKDRPSKNKSAK